jgi:protein-disulfide isomerase
MESAPPKKLLGGAKFVVAFIATLGLGYLAGQWIQKWRRPPVEIETGDRYLVELRGDEPQKGAAEALVTIVEFSDFQCPYCARAVGPLDEAVSDHADEVRLVFKHYPLPGHQNALPAAYLAWAAHRQGKFWEMHDRLFEAKGDISQLSTWATELGLDAERLGADMESQPAKDQVDADHLAGGKIGVGGTPSFVVNGHMYSGVKTADDWETIIAAELEVARGLVDAGTPPGEVYAAIMKDAATSRGRGSGGKAPSERPQAQRRAGEPDPAKVYAVPTGEGRPQLGRDDALVTIVEFADFHCPYCGKVADTVERLQATYPEDVRLVFRQRPLAIHPKAREAAKAALAAHRQGKFWEVQEVLFTERPGDAEALAKIAERIGLDVERFRADLADPAIEAMLVEDEGVADRFGARGTPAFFVNGRFVGGAQPYSVFDTLVVQELEKARARVEEGVAPAEVYATILAQAETKVED